MNFNEYMKLDLDKKFDYFMNTRFPTNRTPYYWVNWNKVTGNLDDIEISLNTMNYLVGKDDIFDKTKKLFIDQPNLIKTIPILIACRDSNIDVLNYDDNYNMETYKLDFKNPNIYNIDAYVHFMQKTGLMSFLRNNVNKSLVDYVFGVEVGLDSNGRKNRGGTENENILERNLQLVINHNPECEYGTQETAKSIKKRWNIVVPETLEKGKKGGRRYDGVIYNPRNKKLLIIETNFYGSGGSKLKAVSGEFSDMYNQSLKNAKNIDFAWISDGPGWNTAKNPLREAFDSIPNIINLNMVNNGYLSEIIK